MVTVSCTNCGKEKRIAKAELNVRNFCSRTCSNQYKSPTLRQLPDPETIAGGLAFSCRQCGKEFRAKAYRTRKYCSRVCMGLNRRGKRWANQPAEKPQIRGEGNPNYRDGLNRVTARKNALKAYGEACVICRFNAVVQVHHIVAHAEGGKNSIDNLIVLCPNHHAMADRNLITPDELRAWTAAATSPKQDRQDPLHRQSLFGSSTSEAIQ